MRKPARWLAAAILAAVALVASSCTNPGTDAASGGVLRIALGTGTMTKNFNPFSPGVGLPDGSINLVYEPLIQFNVARPGQVYPWLARSYRWARGGRTLTFTVRDGVRWTNGRPFTAGDVAFTFDLLLKHPELNLVGLDYTKVSQAGKTVTLSFPRPAYTELYYLSNVPIVARSHWAPVKNPAKFLDPNPVGTGPYTIRSFASHDVTFAKNPHYWQSGRPAVGTVDITTYNSNNGALTALTSGDADWGQQFFPELDKQWLTNPNRHFFAPSVGMNALYLNLTKWPLNNVTVRKAISAAIDRQQLSTQAEGGIYPPAQSPTGLALPNQSAYLAPRYKNVGLPFRPAQARSLLAQAGFHRGGNGIMQDASGRPLKLTLTEWAGSADYMASAQIIAANLKKVGIGVTINGLSSQAWAAAVSDGNFDMTIKWSQIGPGPFYMYDGWLNSKYYEPAGQGASNDLSRFSSHHADQLLSTISATRTGSAQQMSAYHGLEAIMADQLPVVPLFNLTELCAYTTDHFVGWPSTHNPYSRCVAVDEKTIVTIRPK